ncbi:unnamed protein product [Hymenolepis diminuta]|uniref:Kelch repeat protein n=1 Tax=Hymenolepis diminuta TaxID=6216 RepID=A0A0R3SK55_HYMDI|nr:unnamed protein product [Hymenolepis diminuta]
MIEERSRCAAVSIPGSGVLVIGGIGRNRLPLRSTELLTRLPNEGGGEGDDEWQWRHFPPMNKDHGGDPLVVYFQGRVYVVGWGENASMMEMLDVAAGSQWTFLTSFTLRQRLCIYSMARVGNKLFLKEYRNRLLDFLRHCTNYKHDPRAPQYKITQTTIPIQDPRFCIDRSMYIMGRQIRSNRLGLARIICGDY